MATYVPGTLETDPKKVIMSLQQIGPKTDANTASIATNTTDIATINAAIAGGIVNTIAGNRGAFTLSHGLTNSGNDLRTVITAAETFLQSDVLLNNTANYFDVVNTGSVGANGQIWLVITTAYLIDTGGGASFLIRIWDGSSTVFKESGINTNAANIENTITIFTIVTLSGATTFTLSVKDRSNTTGKVQTTGVAGTAHRATSIAAVRLL